MPRKGQFLSHSLRFKGFGTFFISPFEGRSLIPLSRLAKPRFRSGKFCDADGPRRDCGGGGGGRNGPLCAPLRRVVEIWRWGGGKAAVGRYPSGEGQEAACPP